MNPNPAPALFARCAAVRRRAAFTLIELLIALAILLAIGAIVAPLLIRTLDERRFESAAELIQHQLVLARAHAQRRGEMIEVRFDPDQRSVTAHRFAPGDASAEVALRSEHRQVRGDAREKTSDDVIEHAAALTESWADRRLPRGLQLSDEPPHSRAIDDRDSALAFVVDPIAETPGSDETIQLVVFLPDGSARFTRDVWLTDDHDRIGRIRVNSMTGMVQFERTTAELADDADGANAAREDGYAEDDADTQP